MPNALALALAAAGCRSIRPLDLFALRAAARTGGILGKRGSNPMPRLATPLPVGHSRRGDLTLAPRCQACCKHDRRPCRQPAMRGKRVCRMHGGKAGAPRGKRNGAYVHGGRTLACRALLRTATWARRRLAAALAIVRTETRFERRADVERIIAARPDGTTGPAIKVTMTDRRVWREGGPARVLRAFAALRAAADVGPHGGARQRGRSFPDKAAKAMPRNTAGVTQGGGMAPGCERAIPAKAKPVAGTGPGGSIVGIFSIAPSIASVPTGRWPSWRAVAASGRCNSHNNDLAPS